MSAPRAAANELDRILLPKDFISSESMTKELRSEILARLWRQSSSQQIDGFSAYFRHFAAECEAWRLSGCAVAIQTYRDFLELVQHLKTYRHEARASPIMLDFFPPAPPAGVQAADLGLPLSSDQILLPLKRRHAHCDQDSVKKSIDLAICLWLMLSTCSPGTISFPGRCTLVWKDTESLNDFLNKTFPKTTFKTPSQWPQSLNLYNLDRSGYFQIIWTNHLADHLYLNEDLRTISVYHHASILHNQIAAEAQEYDPFPANTPTNILLNLILAATNFCGTVEMPYLLTIFSQILPTDLLLETIKTLALLLPRANHDCMSWFQKVLREDPDDLDPKAADLALGGRAQEDYIYWYGRLSLIQNAYDSSEPRSLNQWLNDRRNSTQWYTFWVAILILVLTVVFGMIQSIASIMQVYVAYHPA